MRKNTNRNNLILIAVLLAVITLVAYWGVLNAQFITVYDDDGYVLSNTHIQNGLNAESIRWALTATYAYNWHPLTWMSHMLDYQLYGLNPTGHHATSLLIHIASTVLLFLVLTRMTKSVWKSAFVAAMFGVHPTHVESVAWVAERKDVLSAFFWILTMGAYALYVERPSVKRYALVVLSFVLGLMSKPMLVTLPIVLLFLDFWPLGRLRSDAKKSKSKESTRWVGWKLITEKAPLFALTAASSAITYYAQQHGGAVRTLAELPVTVRAANSVVAYVQYIGKMIWPTKLAVMYPHPGSGLPVWQVITAVSLMVGVTALAMWLRKRHPYLLAGWLWYVVTLVPVIGLAQVGDQAMANRYTYVPLIGLFLAVTWGIAGIFTQKSTDERQHHSMPLTVVASLVIAVMAACTWVQVGHWHNGVTLFDYAVRSTQDNTTALGNLGWAQISVNSNFDAAGECFAKALAVDRDLYDMHYGLGIVYNRVGRYGEAVKELTEALRLKPDLEQALRQLRIAQGLSEDFTKSGLSRTDFQQAMAHYNNGATATGQGDAVLAMREYREAIRIRPDFAEAYSNVGVILKDRNDLDGAAAAYRKALQLKPELTEAHNNLAVIYYMQDRYTEAWEEIHAAEKYGYVPNPQLLDALSEQMPDPSPNQP